MEPVTIGILISVGIFQLLSFGLQMTKMVKKSTCMGSSVEFRSGKSINEMNIGMGQSPSGS
jgi:hypothetical protein